MSKNFPEQKLLEYGFRKVLVSVGGYPANEVYKYESDLFTVSPLSDGSWSVISKRLQREGYMSTIARIKDESGLDQLLTYYGNGAIIDERNDLSLLKFGSCY